MTPPAPSRPPDSRASGSPADHGAVPLADPPVARLLDEAAARMRAGRLAEAGAMLEAALRLRPDHPAALQQLGVVRYQCGRPVEALALLERAVALAPDYADAHFNLGNVHLNEGRFAEAESCFRRALAAAPRHRDALINLAGVQRGQGRISDALASGRRALEVDPGHPATHCLLARLMWDSGEPVGALHHYRRALALRPGDPEAQRALGALLLEQGQMVPAATELRKAVEASPGDTRLRALMERAYAHVLPGWHLPMLADTARNEAFERAIGRAAPGRQLVLDIGTGSGLLALMAARAGAARVVACEMVEPLADVAGRVVAANGYAGRITVLARRSFDLEVGRDLPERADLILAEVLDVGLLGEEVLPILRDALARLAAPGVKVIPAGATVHAVLIECPLLRQGNPLREVCGFDLGAMNIFRPLAQPRTVDLDHLPHRTLTAPVEVARFDFRHPPSGPTEQTLALAATADGTAHAVAYWFQLHLDEEVSLSTAPGTPLNHWRQSAVFLETDVPLRAGQPVGLVVGHDDRRFRFRAEPGF